MRRFRLGRSLLELRGGERGEERRGVRRWLAFSLAAGFGGLPCCAVPGRFVALSFPLGVCVVAFRSRAFPVGGCSERVFMLAYLCFVWFL